jgi:hypothetical protein
MKKLFSILYFVLIALCARAQKITLSGYVQDSKSKEKLIGATVYLPSLKVGLQTNAYGFYSITISNQKSAITAKAF